MKRSTYTLRRLLALVLVLVMTCSLFAGCSKEKVEETTPVAPSETIEQTEAPTEAVTEAPTEEPTEAPTEPAATEPTVGMGTVNADNLNVRSEPYSTADILKRLAINTRVEILEEKIVDGVKWGRIAEGWLNRNYVTLDSEATGTGVGTVVENDNNIGSGNVVTPTSNNATITATELNIRQYADADSASVGVYLKGDKVTVLERNGNWGRTNKGWINLKYVDLTGSVPSTTSGSYTGTGSSSSSSSSSGSNATTVSDGNKVVLGRGTVARTSSLAVRSGPGANYVQKGFIRLGQTKDYYQRSNGWVRFSSGWVNANYLDLEYVVASGTVGTISTSALNVRQEPDANSSALATYKKDDSVTILEVEGIWGKVEYALGQYGWINLDYVKLPTATSSAYTTGDATVTAEALHYRAGAGTSYSALGTYEKGDKVTILEVNGNWGRTDLGWINLKYVWMDSYYTDGVGVVTASKLNIRSQPSTSGKDLGSLKKGAEVVILDVEGNWGKIEYKEGKYGWISLSYVEMTGTSTGSGSSTTGTKYKVTVQTPGNGTASVSSTSCAQGTTVTVTAKPATGYVLDKVTVVDAKGDSVAVVNDKTFAMPASNVTVTVAFKAATPHSITTNITGSGSIDVVSTAIAGQKVSFTVNGNGHALSSLTVKDEDDKTVAVSSNSFTMPDSNVTITAAFTTSSATYYTVGEPTVDPAGKATVTRSVTSAVEGETVTLNIEPKSGYTLKTVTVKNGTSNVTVSGTGNVRTFKMPKGNVSIAVAVQANDYTVSKSVTGSGLVSLSSSKCAVETDVTVTATPSDGYYVKEIKAYGPNNVIVPVSGNTFTMPGYNVTVYVTFEKIPYTLSFSDDGHGSVEASSTATAGSKVNLTIKPDAGYELDKITVNGTEISTNSFTMPASNVTVNATFKKITYSITANSTGNGSVSVTPGSAKIGDSFAVTVAPQSGNELKSLTVKSGSTSLDAVSISGNVYTYTMPAGNVSISAVFQSASPVYYDVNISSSIANGTVTATPASAKAGDTVSLSSTANSGYELEAYTVDGTPITGNTFTMPAKDVTIGATFKTVAPSYKITVTAFYENGNRAEGITFAIKDQNTMNAVSSGTKTTNSNGVAVFTSFGTISENMKLVADCNATLYSTSEVPVRTATVKSGSITKGTNADPNQAQYLLVNGTGSFEGEFVVYLKNP